MLAQQAAVQLDVADPERRVHVERVALRVRSERAEELRSARDERVEHRIDVRERRVRGRRGADLVERLVDPEIVRETEELREEVAAPVLERRGARAEVAQRPAVQEVRADRLILQRRRDLTDLEA